MGRSNETFSKKEKEKKRHKKQQEKREKAEMRKANSSKGMGIESMLAYVDENGNITDTPPVTTTPKKVKAEDISIKTEKLPPAIPGQKSGIITFYNVLKGFGFIRDQKTRASIYFHNTALSFDAKENDLVTFGTEQGARGLQAVHIEKM